MGKFAEREQKLLLRLFALKCKLKEFYISKKCRKHGGVTCHDFGYGCAAGVPEPHPIHIPGQVKNMTHSYTSHIEN